MSQRSIAVGVVLSALLATASARATPFATTLYQFTGKSDGSNPLGGVIEDAAGTIYGETFTGGTTACSSSQDPYNKGCGTVYSFTPAGGLKVLATFTGPNGAHGNISLTLVGNTLYGVTKQGGANDDGVVFSVRTDGSKFTVLHQFSGGDGSAPDTLVAGAGGMIYGTTLMGGANNYGTLYSVTSAGVFSLLYTFGVPLNGYPTSLITAPNGILVGSTMYGGGMSKNNPFGFGTVFSYIPASARFSTLYAVPLSGSHGASPAVGSIGPGPAIYGSDEQEVFSLSMNSGFVALADFNLFTMGGGTAPIITPDGTLFGIIGGTQNTAGGVYSVQDGEIVVDAYVDSGPGPYQMSTAPAAHLFRTSGGTFVGTTFEGGRCLDCGAIWQYMP